MGVCMYACMYPNTHTGRCDEGCGQVPKGRLQEDQSERCGGTVHDRPLPTDRGLKAKPTRLLSFVSLPSVAKLGLGLTYALAESLIVSSACLRISQPRLFYPLCGLGATDFDSESQNLQDEMEDLLDYSNEISEVLGRS